MGDIEGITWVVEEEEEEIIVEEQEIVTIKVQDPDQRDFGLEEMQNSEFNIGPTGVNYSKLKFGDKAVFMVPDEDGDSITTIRATACIPGIKSVTNRGQVTFVFPREIYSITKAIRKQIKQANAI